MASTETSQATISYHVGNIPGATPTAIDTQDSFTLVRDANFTYTSDITANGLFLGNNLRFSTPSYSISQTGNETDSRTETITSNNSMTLAPGVVMSQGLNATTSSNSSDTYTYDFTGHTKDGFFDEAFVVDSDAYHSTGTQTSDANQTTTTTQAISNDNLRDNLNETQTTSKNDVVTFQVDDAGHLAPTDGDTPPTWIVDQHNIGETGHECFSMSDVGTRLSLVIGGLDRTVTNSHANASDSGVDSFTFSDQTAGGVETERLARDSNDSFANHWDTVVSVNNDAFPADFSDVAGTDNYSVTQTADQTLIGSQTGTATAGWTWSQSGGPSMNNETVAPFALTWTSTALGSPPDSTATSIFGVTSGMAYVAGLIKAGNPVMNTGVGEENAVQDLVYRTTVQLEITQLAPNAARSSEPVRQFTFIQQYTRDAATTATLSFFSGASSRFTTDARWKYLDTVYTTLSGIQPYTKPFTGDLSDITSFVTAWGDAASNGLTAWIRQKVGYDNVVNKTSIAYTLGYVGGTVNVLLIEALSGGAGPGEAILNAVGNASAVVSGTEAVLGAYKDGDVLGMALGVSQIVLGVTGSAMTSTCNQSSKVLAALQMFVTGANIATNMNDAINQFKNGNYGDAAISALTAASDLFLLSCFTGETPLRTPSGSKRIDQILVGDYVLARNEFDPDGPVEPKVVEEVFLNHSQILHLHVADHVIRTTESHPFFAESKGWVDAGALAPGNRIATMDGGWVTVQDISRTGEEEPTYNVRVAEHHTYFVGGDDWDCSVWAHNACSSTSGNNKAAKRGRA